MAQRGKGSVQVSGVDVSFEFVRRDRSASSAVIIDAGEDVAPGDAINEIFIRNTSVLDIHASQVFFRRDSTLQLAHFVGCTCQPQTWQHIVEPETVTLEDFA